MSWTLCTSGSALAKAGYYANGVIRTSGARLAEWSDEAESIICGIARNAALVSSFASLTANGKYILQNLASNLIAQKVLAYDTTGLNQRAAETILDVIENDIVRGISILKDANIKTFLGAQ